MLRFDIIIALNTDHCAMMHHQDFKIVITIVDLEFIKYILTLN